MDTKIVTTLISTSGPLLAALVAAIFKLKSERKKHDAQAESFVSTGVAVGYYYNFIRPVFERLQATDEIKVSINKKGSDQEECQRIFQTDNVEIQIIIPAELTESAMRAARDYAKVFRKGNILRKNGERDFAIQLSTDDAIDRLIIQDVANPLNAVRQYIENLEEFKSVLTESGGIIDNTNSQGFRDRQKKEIENFITAVRFFTKKEGYADKKIGFKPL